MAVVNSGRERAVLVAAILAVSTASGCDLPWPTRRDSGVLEGGEGGAPAGPRDGASGHPGGADGGASGGGSGNGGAPGGGGSGTSSGGVGTSGSGGTPDAGASSAGGAPSRDAGYDQGGDGAKTTSDAAARDAAAPLPDAWCPGVLVVPQAGAGGPPDWTKDANPIADDPRWAGSVDETFVNVVAFSQPVLRWRFIRSGTTLYVQIQCLSDILPGDWVERDGGERVYLDSVYLGFATEDLASVDVERLAININANPPVDGFRWWKTGGTWLSSFGAYLWILAKTAWVDTRIGGAPVAWVVDLKVDTTAIPGQKVWYEGVVSQGHAAPLFQTGWVGSGGFIEPDPPSTGVLPKTWGEQFDRLRPTDWGIYATTGTCP